MATSFCLGDSIMRSGGGQPDLDIRPARDPARLRRGCALHILLRLFPMSMSYQHIITVEPGKRGGRPCIRGMRITVADILGWLAAGMSHAEIIADFPELTEEDIRAALAYAADRERRIITAAA
jgi:uncharacterized protein (DUF433 family)